METKTTDTVASEAPVEQDGSVGAATEALLNMLDADEASPAVEEEQTPEDGSAEPEEDADSDVEEEEEVDDSESDDDDEYEPDDNRDEEGEETADVFVVKVDGEDTEVGLDELLAGYSRHSDYTRKTQQLSEERKQLEEYAGRYEQELANTIQMREKYAQQLGQYVQQGLHGLQNFANVDWARLKEEDPIEYVTKRDEFREARDRIQAMQNQQQHADAQNRKESQAIHANQLQQEGARLAEVVPEWADEAKRPELAGQIREFAQSVGFSAEEVDAVVDHRAISVLLKAAKYDALHNSDLKTKKVKRNPRVIKAGSRKDKGKGKGKQRKDQFNRLKKSGDAKDAAKLMEDLI